MSPLRADAKLVKWPKEGNFAQWSNFLLPLYYRQPEISLFTLLHGQNSSSPCTAISAMLDP